MPPQGTIQAVQELKERLFDADLSFTWELHCYLFNSPFRSFLSKAVSAHPLNDISLIIWAVFIAYLYDFGEPKDEASIMSCISTTF